ncbi:MAG: hypothetical protein HY905_08430 [Deltaproteobacteria bacterium]|nr:hypothetical protein [Deltaproteobacteria bacterium]
MKRPWVVTVASDACSFTAGTAAALAQVVLVRELFGALEGHEVSVALSLGVWVAGLAAGALAGGRAVRGRDIDAGHLVAALALLAVAALAGLALLRDARALLEVPRGASIGVGGSLLLAALGVGPAALVTGALLPLFAQASGVSRKGRQEAKHAKGGAEGEDGGGRGLRCPPARFYAIDALGTAAGGALAPFLVSWAPAPRLVAVFAAVAAAAPAAASWAGLARPRGRSVWLGGAGLAVLALVAFASDPFEQATQARRREGLGVAGAITNTLETPYERLDVAGSGPGRSQVTLLGNGAVVTVAPDPYGAGATLDLLLFEHPLPRTVLVVGSSAPDAVRVATAHGADEVTLGDFDPWVTAALRDALGPADRGWIDRGQRLEIDARAHLREVPAASYDVVALFPPEPLTALANRFYTREIFRDAARALRPDGLLVLRLPWSANVPDPATLAYGRSVVRAMRASFPYMAVMPGIDALLFASRDPDVVTLDPNELAARAEGRPGLDPRAYPPDFFAESFPAEQTAKLAALLGLDRILPGPVNEDLRPVAYLDRLLAHLARRSTGLATKHASRLPGVLAALAALPAWAWLLPLLVMPPTARLLGRRESLAGLQAGIIAALVGGTGMALEMLLLVAYQVNTGRLYVGYAVLTGAFMLGVAAGAHGGTRLAERPEWRPRAALVRLETVAGILLLGVWAAAPWITASAGLLIAASVVAGLLTGLPFPALTGLAGLRGRGAAAAGAWVMAGDNVGACVGALLATIALLPAHGFGTVVLLLVGARACGAIGLSGTSGASGTIGSSGSSGTSSWSGGGETGGGR